MDKASVHELIKNRRSFYPAQLTGDPLSDTVVNEWLENAVWAPTHKMTEPWKFKVYTGLALQEVYNRIEQLHFDRIDHEIKRKKKLDKLQLMRDKVSHFVFIIMERSTEISIPEVEEIAAVSCAAQNLYLAMDAYGIGGYWSTGNYSLKPVMHRYLNLEEHQQCLGYFALGTPKDIQLPATRTPLSEKVEWHH